MVLVLAVEDGASVKVQLKLTALGVVQEGQSMTAFSMTMGTRSGRREYFLLLLLLLLRRRRRRRSRRRYCRRRFVSCSSSSSSYFFFFFFRTGRRA